MLFFILEKVKIELLQLLILKLDDSLLLVHEGVQGVVQSVHEVGVMDWRLNTYNNSNIKLHQSSIFLPVYFEAKL